jgi:hypothetical protein
LFSGDDEISSGKGKLNDSIICQVLLSSALFFIANLKEFVLIGDEGVGDIMIVGGVGLVWVLSRNGNSWPRAQ